MLSLRSVGLRWPRCADDAELEIIDLNRTAEHVRVGAGHAPPQAVGNQREPCAARQDRRFLSGEVASEDRPTPERIEAR